MTVKMPLKYYIFYNTVNENPPKMKQINKICFKIRSFNSNIYYLLLFFFTKKMNIVILHLILKWLFCNEKLVLYAAILFQIIIKFGTVNSIDTYLKVRNYSHIT